MASVSASSEDSTSDDFSDEENTDTTNTEIHGTIEINVDKSDEFEFDMNFKSIAEKSKRLKLKPSKHQNKIDHIKHDRPCPANTNANINKQDKDKAEGVDDDDGISIQTEVLSEYLKPTNILSKYQS